MDVLADRVRAGASLSADEQLALLDVARAARADPLRLPLYDRLDVEIIRLRRQQEAGETASWARVWALVEIATDAIDTPLHPREGSPPP